MKINKTPLYGYTLDIHRRDWIQTPPEGLQVATKTTKQNPLYRSRWFGMFLVCFFLVSGMFFFFLQKAKRQQKGSKCKNQGVNQVKFSSQSLSNAAALSQLC